MTKSQSILANTAVASGGRLINGALGLFVTALITRLLGPDQFGVYVLIIAYATLLQTAADAGLYLTLARLLGEAPHKTVHFFSHIFSLRLLLFAIIFSLGLSLALFTPVVKSHWPLFLIIAFGFLAQSISQLLMAIFQARGNIWPATAGDLLGRLIQIISLLALFKFYPDLISATVAFSLGAIVSLVIHRFYLPFKIKPQLDKNLTKEIIQTTWPLGALLLLNVVYFRIDTLILSYFRPSPEVGLYGLAYRVIESALFFPAMFGGLLLPRLAEARSMPGEDGPRHLSRLLQESLHLILIAIGFILAVLLLLSPSIIAFIAGPDFIAASPLLQVLSLALAIMFIGNIFGFTLVALKQQKNLLKIYAALAFFNLIANLIFIPRFGAPAAAWTTVVTELIATTSAAFIIFKRIRFSFPLQNLLKIITAALLTALFIRLLSSSLPIMVTLSLAAAVYLLSIYSLGLLSKKHLHLLLLA